MNTKQDNSEPLPASDLFADVSKDDLANLCVFLAGYQSKLNDLRGVVLSFGTDEDERKSKSWQQVAMHWPIIQGSRNQIALTRIGEHQHDSAAVSRAVSSANDLDQVTPKGRL